jgi:hypothetical protein
MTAKAQPATMPSCAVTAPEGLSSSSTRNAASPMIVPTRKTTRPADSGGMKGRRRDHARDSAISTRPAKIVMPHTSGRPPAFTASRLGARYTPVKIAGASRRLPTGPFGRACRNTATARARSPSCRMLVIASGGRPTCRAMIRG